MLLLCGDQRGLACGSDEWSRFKANAVFVWDPCLSASLVGLSVAHLTSRRDAQALAASGTPHSTTVDERKKELGVDILKYSKDFMYQFAEVRLLAEEVQRSAPAWS